MSDKSTALCADRYHAVMGNFLLGAKPFKVVKAMGDLPAVFYATERKIPYAPALGHERIVNLLNRSRADVPRARFLAEDRANLKLIAERLRRSRFPGKVYTVPEGTIIFAGEPIALGTGPSAMTQMFEVVFEHAFDEPMTWAYNAMKMKEVIGPDIFLSDFSLRRAGSFERAVEASKYLYIGGCDDTSNMEAAFTHGIPLIGTMAHYLVQIFMAFVSAFIKRGGKIPADWLNEKGNLKHPQRICFEYWLDAHPNGTVCLVDTINLKLGMIHLIEAALSSPQRRQALRAARLDSGDLALGAIYIREMFDANGLSDKKIVLTGDLNAEKSKEIIERLGRYSETLKSVGVMGMAIGTKGVAEVDPIAGVIFKMVSFWLEPTMKFSASGKETLPGNLQLWRCENEQGQYIFDVISRDDEYGSQPAMKEVVRATPLISLFWKEGAHQDSKTPQELKAFVEEQKKKFIVPLEEYGKTRIKLSPALTKLKECLKEEYTKTPPTSIEVVDWPE